MSKLEVGMKCVIVDTNNPEWNREHMSAFVGQIVTIEEILDDGRIYIEEDVQSASRCVMPHNHWYWNEIDFIPIVENTIYYNSIYRNHGR